MKHRLFLIPTYLDESNDTGFISPMIHDILRNTDYYLVENVRTARRFIGSLKLGIDISQLRFEELNKKSSAGDITRIMTELISLGDVGVMSEAGLPGLADPGNLAVSWAHKNSIQVVPLPGTSSIQMALVASGFNGQQFTFHGYLPIDKDEQAKKIKQLENEVGRTGYTQIFMETPFRNNQLLQSLMTHCSSRTLLSIAAGISGQNEIIATKTIGEWKSINPDLHKIPTVFCVGLYPN
jgi:16S rRNA (cytidine1402-2'-O)-methyltransferase